MLSPGQSLGDIVLTRELARGATSTVWEAAKGDYQLAVKIYRPHVFEHSSKDKDNRIKQEVEAGRAAHPNLCRVHGWARYHIADTTYRCVLMDLIPGQTLERYVSDSGPAPYHHFCAIATQLLDAVEHLHASGVLHRDLKSANVVIATEDTRCVIVDFGVAVMERLDLVTTASHEFLGTLHYSAPEWVFRQPPEAANHPALDIYGLGAIYYEVLTGHRPFSHLRNTAELVEAIRKEPPHLDVPGVPYEVQSLVRMMLAKDPCVRPTLAQTRLILLNAAPEPSAAPETSPVASLLSRLAGRDEYRLAAQRREQSEKRLRAFESLRAHVFATVQDWATIHPLYQVPGVTGISKFGEWGIRGNVNAHDLMANFPDRQWDFGFGVRADTVPPLVSAAVVYYVDGDADNHHLVRFQTCGGVTPRIFIDTAKSWYGTHAEIMRQTTWEGEEADYQLQQAMDRANP